MMALDYSTAGQERERLREMLKRIRNYRGLGEVRGKFVKNKDLTRTIIAVACNLLFNFDEKPFRGLVDSIQEKLSKIKI